MTDVRRIEPEDEQYEALFGYWKNEGGREIVWGGVRWLAIQDNDKFVFVEKTADVAGIDEGLGSSSMPSKSVPKEVETSSTKKSGNA